MSELSKIIKEELKKGYSKEEIINALRKLGKSEEEINRAFSELKHMSIIVGVGVIMIIALIFWIFYSPNFTKEGCKKLLLQHEPDIANMKFQKYEIDYHLVPGKYGKAVWEIGFKGKPTGNELFPGIKEYEKQVAFVKGVEFEGCAIREVYPLTKNINLKGYGKVYKCKKEIPVIVYTKEITPKYNFYRILEKNLKLKKIIIETYYLSKGYRLDNYYSNFIKENRCT